VYIISQLAGGGAKQFHSNLGPARKGAETSDRGQRSFVEKRKKVRPLQQYSTRSDARNLGKVDDFTQGRGRTRRAIIVIRCGMGATPGRREGKRQQSPIIPAGKSDQNWGTFPPKDFKRTGKKTEGGGGTNRPKHARAAGEHDFPAVKGGVNGRLNEGVGIIPERRFNQLASPGHHRGE